MNEKKIIPCLDVKDGKVVKGVKFVDLQQVGDPVEIAKAYEKQGADELVFLDITATTENRATVVDQVSRVASAITIPLSVGGGIRTVDDFRTLLAAGAAKVAVNSAAVRNPSVIEEAAKEFGSKKVISAIDVTKAADGSYHVLVDGGKTDTGIDALWWAKEVERLGAGEILVTSLDADGTKDGYDIPMTAAVTNAVSIPVTASGGAGKLADFGDVLEQTGCAAALAASLFHFSIVTVPDVKSDLKKRGIKCK